MVLLSLTGQIYLPGAWHVGTLLGHQIILLHLSLHGRQLIVLSSMFQVRLLVMIALCGLPSVQVRPLILPHHFSLMRLIARSALRLLSVVRSLGLALPNYFHII